MRPIIPNRWLKQAPLVIVGCSQLDIISNRIGTRVTGIEYYQIDLGIAMEHMVLKATELGLGTCWIGSFNPDTVRRILGIPEQIVVVELLPLGYPKDPEPVTKSRQPLETIVRYERW